MAKDDYDKIVCQILLYLYSWIRGKTDTEPEIYLQPMTKDLPISEEYFQLILENMLEKGLIRGISITRAWGGDIIGINGIGKIRITDDGIHYLKENSQMQNVLRWMRDNAVKLPGMITTALELIQS